MADRIVNLEPRKTIAKRRHRARKMRREKAIGGRDQANAAVAVYRLELLAGTEDERWKPRLPVGEPEERKPERHVRQMIVRRLLLPTWGQENSDSEVRCRLRLFAAVEMQLPALVTVLDRGKVAVERVRDRRCIDAERTFRRRHEPVQAVSCEIDVTPDHLSNGAPAFWLEILA